MKLSRKHVDEALKAAGINARIAKGNGYWFFYGPAFELAESSMVCVNSLNQLTASQWVFEAKTLLGVD